MKPRVLLVTAEAVPLAKTGGLADVISALAAALRAQRVDATILMPGYGPALAQAPTPLQMAALNDLPGGDGRLWRTRMPGSDIPVILLDTPRFRNRRENPYVGPDGREHEDNAVCFASLAHAAARICAGTTSLPVPHIMHGHDWHAGLVPGLLKAAGVKNVGSVFSIHNLAFQGNYPVKTAEQLGLPEAMRNGDGMAFWGQLSFLKAGLHYADRIVTVSHSYAREILTPEFGCGMDDILRRRRRVLRAVPNGVDIDCWGPALDELIPCSFDADDMQGKLRCKAQLQKEFGLAVDPRAFIVAVGSRMTHQKMADVVAEAIPQLLAIDARIQLVVLGCGDGQYEDAFRKLGEVNPQRVGVQIGYDERTAHLLHAGADVLLHGSRFEPFGLTPIYAMLYGTVPISSRVGGLRDTVVDEAQATKDSPANGFLFDGESVAAMVAAVQRAFERHDKHPIRWRILQRNGMRMDFGWEGPARDYIDIYREAAPDSVRGLFAPVLSGEREASLSDRSKTIRKGGLMPAYGAV